MLRPPLLPSILLAASCLFFFTPNASAQPAWDTVEDEGGSSSASSGSSGGSDNEAPPNFRSSAPVEADPESVTPAPRAARAVGPTWEGGEDGGLDAKLAKVDEALKSVQAPLWAYTIGWSALQAGLAGYYGWDATTREHERAKRCEDIMLASVAGLNAVLVLLKPMPARGAYSKFKKMPDGTTSEKRLKVDYGVQKLAHQIGADKHNARPEEHVVAALVGIGFGAGLLFGYDQDNIRPAVEATLGVILLAELQFATRPWRTRRFNRELALMGKNAPPPPVELSFAPMVNKTSRGISLVGRF
jgi:hypothetical protein